MKHVSPLVTKKERLTSVAMTPVTRPHACIMLEFNMFQWDSNKQTTPNETNKKLKSRWPCTHLLAGVSQPHRDGDGGCLVTSVSRNKTQGLNPDSAIQSPSHRKLYTSPLIIVQMIRLKVSFFQASVLTVAQPQCSSQ